VPALANASNCSSVSGVATRVNARTLAYETRRMPGPGPAWASFPERGPLVPAPAPARVEPDPPGEPGGARTEAVVPAAAGVELSDEVEEAGGGGVEVRRQLGDLVAEAIQFGSGRQRGRNVGRFDLHARVSLPLGATLHPGFRESREARERADFDAIRNFATRRSQSTIAGRCWLAEAIFPRRGPRAANPRREGLSSKKCVRQNTGAGAGEGGLAPRIHNALPAI
jgi:hypothetical protein